MSACRLNERLERMNVSQKNRAARLPRDGKPKNQPCPNDSSQSLKPFPIECLPLVEGEHLRRRRIRHPLLKRRKRQRTSLESECIQHFSQRVLQRAMLPEESGDLESEGRRVTTSHPLTSESNSSNLRARTKRSRRGKERIRSWRERDAESEKASCRASK